MPKSQSEKAPSRDFVRVGRSRIEGTGVFAKRKIAKGTRIIEYIGERVPVSSFLVAASEGNAPSIYAFRVNDSFIIDGAINGNESRFINHACDPNCEAYVFDDKPYIYAMRDITRGEELTFDYRLHSTIRTTITAGDRERHRCLCGSENCRGTMIADKKKRTRKP
ncbi:SET domain-containing protein-lysine N-methyltransferase [soil metagenome]